MGQAGSTRSPEGGRRKNGLANKKQMGARHRAGDTVRHQPRSHSPKAPGQARRGPHLRLRLRVPGLGLLQEFFKGGFHVCLHWPFTVGKTDRQDVTGWSCHLSEWTGCRSGSQAWSSSSRGNPVSGVREGAERTPLKPRPPGGARTVDVEGSSSVSSVGVPGRTRGTGPSATIAPWLTAARTTNLERPEAQV